MEDESGCGHEFPDEVVAGFQRVLLQCGRQVEELLGGVLAGEGKCCCSGAVILLFYIYTLMIAVMFIQYDFIVPFLYVTGRNTSRGLLRKETPVFYSIIFN